MLLKCCTQYASKFEKLSSGHRTGKSQFPFQCQRRAKMKECSNNGTIALISHDGKVRLKILQLRLQQYMKWELPDVQAGFRKDRGTIDQIANIRWMITKPKEFQKNIYFCFIDYAKAFAFYWSTHFYCVWITINCGKSWKKWKYQTTWPATWEICMHVKKQQLEPGIEQWTGSKLGKECVKSVYCHPAYFLICRVHHGKCWAGWSASWSQDCWEKYQ